MPAACCRSRPVPQWNAFSGITGGARKKARKSGDGEGLAGTGWATGAKKPRKGQNAASKRGGKHPAPPRLQHISLDGGESDGGSDLSGRPLATRVGRAVSLQPMDCDVGGQAAVAAEASAADSHPKVAATSSRQAATVCGGAGPVQAMPGHRRDSDGGVPPDQGLGPTCKDPISRLPGAGIMVTSPAVTGAGNAMLSSLQVAQYSSPSQRQRNQPATSAPSPLSPCGGGDAVVPPTPESQVRPRDIITLCTTHISSLNLTHVC